METFVISERLKELVFFPAWRTRQPEEAAALMKDPKERSLVTTPRRSGQMARVRQADTPAELAVRRILHALGTRFRIHGKGLPGRPDIVNRARRWAIFVHGCYWHAHQGCPRWRLPKRNREFWAQKFAANRARDLRKLEALRQLGYNVLVVWECELEAESALREKLLAFLTAAAETE